MNQRLYRSREERILGGVAGGVADYLRTDPSIIRVLWAILMLFSGGLFFLLYVVMWIVVPEEPYDRDGSYAWPGPPGAPGGPPAAAGEAGPAGASPSTVAGPAAAPIAGPTSGPTAGPASEPAPSPTSPSQPAGGWIPPGASTGRPPSAPVDPWALRRAERAARRAERRANRDVSGSAIFGLILVLVGAFFLIRMYVPSLDTGWLWPTILVIVGVALLLGSVRRGPGTPRG